MMLRTALSKTTGVYNSLAATTVKRTMAGNVSSQTSAVSDRIGTTRRLDLCVIMRLF